LQSPRRPSRPLLIAFLRWLLVFWIVLAILITVLSVLAPPDTSYKVNGNPVTREYWMKHVSPWPIVAVVVLGSLAYAFWRDRTWSRHLLTGLSIASYPVSFLVLGLSRAERVHLGLWALDVVTGILGLVLIVWYFYYKENVVDYYDQLKRMRSSSPAR